MSLPCMGQNYSADEKDAVYMATLKAVVDYKMSDAENLKQLEKLREDKNFNDKLQKMIDKLNNKKFKSGSDRRVYELLTTTGKKIYNELN